MRSVTLSDMFAVAIYPVWLCSIHYFNKLRSN